MEETMIRSVTVPFLCMGVSVCRPHVFARHHTKAHNDEKRGPHPKVGRHTLLGCANDLLLLNTGSQATRDEHHV
jgi:hypothetical protein